MGKDESDECTVLATQIRAEMLAKQPDLKPAVLAEIVRESLIDLDIDSRSIDLVMHDIIEQRKPYVTIAESAAKLRKSETDLAQLIDSRLQICYQALDGVRDFHGSYVTSEQEVICSTITDAVHTYSIASNRVEGSIQGTTMNFHGTPKEQFEIYKITFSKTTIRSWLQRLLGRAPPVVSCTIGVNKTIIEHAVLVGYDYKSRGKIDKKFNNAVDYIAYVKANPTPGATYITQQLLQLPQTVNACIAQRDTYLQKFLPQP